MYSVYYGEISKERKEKWDNGEENPYNVLMWRKQISGCSGQHFIYIARRLFKDEIQIDWGSFAWKAMKEDIFKLKEEWNAEFDDEKILKEDIEYGVVFIEEVS